jgi:hypothetical protein
MAMKSIINKSQSQLLYDMDTKKTLLRVGKWIDANEVHLPDDHDATVEDANGNQGLKYPYAVSVRIGMLWMKADRDALAECFPGVVAPIPRASNYRDR